MGQATLESLYMSFVALGISFLFALPLGTLVCETRPEGLFKNRVLNLILNRVIDIGRSIPFILLVVFLFPVTRALVGTSIGTTAMIVPLSICAIPFEARLVEEILSEVPKSVVEAAQIDGAGSIRIIVTMKWGSKISLLLNCLSISLINIIGYSAMAGVVGGGGLGNFAIVFGFQRFDWMLILYSVLIIVSIVVTIQIINNLLVRFLKRRSL